MAGRPLRRARMNSALLYASHRHNPVAQDPVTTNKTYADLLAELRWLGPASVMSMVLIGNTRQCGHVASAITQYLLERGFVATAAKGAGKYSSHYDLAVLTSDRGWVSVDPTAIQFHAPNSESDALRIAADEQDIDTRELSRQQRATLVARFFEPTVQWSVEGMLDGTRAFEITAAPHIRKDQAPSEPYAPGVEFFGSTWRTHWEVFRQMAEDLARGDFSQIDDLRPQGRGGSRPFWMNELSRRLRGRQLSR